MIARYSFLFFVVMGFIVIPFLSYFLCSKLLNRRYGRRVGLALACVIIGLVIYGMTFGFSQINVRQVEFVSKDLPEAFDGYRIVQFSDAHVATFDGWLDDMVPQIVDSINNQKADMIVFTGDLQNLRPDELAPKVAQLSQLHAPDGVYSILGNHDYATYLDLDEASQKKNNLKTQQLERQMNWTLLMNENRIIRRGSDSIVIAGMENWGVQKRMPRNGDVRKTMKGISPKSFTVMLQHDPNAWRAKILPECNAQLTLSGHTHGGQFSLFGWTPANFTYSECFGTYYEGDRAICVSSGLGGLIPFRLGQPGEIVVITLKKK
jgi:hypothetical protein